MWMETVIPAGQYLDSGPAYIGRFTAVGNPLFNSLRWLGWSCSWFVPLLYSEAAMSKLTCPSGLGCCFG